MCTQKPHATVHYVDVSKLCRWDFCKRLSRKVDSTVTLEFPVSFSVGIARHTEVFLYKAVASFVSYKSTKEQWDSVRHGVYTESYYDI